MQKLHLLCQKWGPHIMKMGMENAQIVGTKRVVWTSSFFGVSSYLRWNFKMVDVYILIDIYRRDPFPQHPWSSKTEQAEYDDREIENCKTERKINRKTRIRASLPPLLWTRSRYGLWHTVSSVLCASSPQDKA